MSANSLPPDDLPLSFYLVKQCKLWVWDFDDTLIDTNTYLKNKMDVISIRKRTNAELDEEIPQWKYFKRLIEFITTHGKYVGIASFGTYEIIRAYMDRIFGFNQKYFGKQNIIAPCMAERDSRRFTVPPNKNEYIYQLMKIYRVQDFGRVVLFDDMPSNISSATAIGVIGVQIATPRNGDIDTSKMYFGPWLMTELDNKGVNSICGNQCVGDSKANLVNTENFEGDSFEYVKSAFGTGIGDRKITKKPEYRWNKMNAVNPPIWQNGNWQTDGAIMTIDTYPESSLANQPFAPWDNNRDGFNTYNNTHNMYSKNSMVGKNNMNNNMTSAYSNTIEDGIEGFQDFNNNGSRHTKYFRQNNNSKNNNNNNSRNNNNNNNKNIKQNRYEDKYLNGDNCESCKKITWNWITLSLILIIFMMVALCFSVK
jgi:hypothetical protein